MERREEMTLADFINACPANCDCSWFDLLEVDEIRDAYAAARSGDESMDAACEVESKFVAENKRRTVSVYWPEHCLSRRISSDCACSLV